MLNVGFFCCGSDPINTYEDAGSILNLLSGLRIQHCHELQCGSLGQVELGTGRNGKCGWLFYPHTTIGIGGEEVIGTAAPDAGPRRQVMSFPALAGLGALGT